MLIDSFAPNPHAVERHRIVINAARETVYAEIWKADLGGPATKLLLVLRSLPGLVMRGCRPLPRNQRITLQTLIDSGFGLLAEEPGKEIVLGIEGKFWRPVGNLLPFHRDNFNFPVRPGTARAVWNFSVNADDDGRTVLSTETRVTCGDHASRRKFLTYWFFVRPFSGLIRIFMLRRVRRAVRQTSVCRDLPKEAA